MVSLSCPWMAMSSDKYKNIYWGRKIFLTVQPATLAIRLKNML